MTRKLIALSLCMIFLSVSTLAFAETVYMTKYGKKYHTKNCPLIQGRDLKEVDLKVAQEKGFQPCKRCMKDKGAALETQKQKKISKSKNKTAEQGS